MILTTFMAERNTDPVLFPLKQVSSYIEKRSQRMPTWLQVSALQMRGAVPADGYRLVDISKMFTQSMV